jgi:ubiquitin carboxyl-terminal hydrolase 8
MKSLLQKADTSARQADAHLEFRRPDLAFIEYLAAFTILVNLVPRHKDFPELNKRRGELWQLNAGLKAVCHMSLPPASFLLACSLTVLDLED